MQENIKEMRVKRRRSRRRLRLRSKEFNGYQSEEKKSKNKNNNNIDNLTIQRIQIDTVTYLLLNIFGFVLKNVACFKRIRRDDLEISSSFTIMLRFSTWISKRARTTSIQFAMKFNPSCPSSDFSGTLLP